MISEKITVCSKISSDGDIQKIEEVKEAKISECGGLTRIEYSTKSDGNEYKSVITVNTGSPLRVHVTHRGAVFADMVFIEGHTHAFTYRVGTCSFDSSVTARSISFDKTDKEKLLIEYDMTVGGHTSFVELCVFRS